MTRVAAGELAALIAAVLVAWGMSPDDADETATLMVEADLSGIDSHGIGMLPVYDAWRAEGRIAFPARHEVVRQTPVTAVIDGGGGLGHVPSARAMRLAIAKARAHGLGAVSVRRSHHYGAAGVYAVMAAREGLVGVSTTAVHLPSIVPTFGAEPRFGTNPIAFAAPAGRHPPVLLDMATSTIAIGKLRLAARAGAKVPLGWALDGAGRPTADPDEALRWRRLTPLGGEPVMSGYKGYGLAMMVEILSTTLGGATYAPLRDPAQPLPDVGHFFLALDPGTFREDGGFAEDVARMVDCLHATPPDQPGRPVLVPGDPEHAARATREREGIPLDASLMAQIRAIAMAAGVAWTIAEAP